MLRNNGAPDLGFHTEITALVTGAHDTFQQDSILALKTATSSLLRGAIDTDMFKVLIKPLDLTIASDPPVDQPTAALAAVSVAFSKGSLDTTSFMNLIKCLVVPTNSNSHDRLDSGVPESTTPIQIDATYPSNLGVPVPHRPMVSSDTMESSSVAASQYRQPPIAFEDDIFASLVPKKKGKKKNSKDIAKAKLQGECIHLLCTACYRLWTVSKLDSVISTMVPDQIVSGHGIIGTTRCSSHTELASTSMTANGIYLHRTTSFPLQAAAHAREVFGKTDVPIIHWEGAILHLTADQIAGLTIGGSLVSSTGFPVGNTADVSTPSRV